MYWCKVNKNLNKLGIQSRKIERMENIMKIAVKVRETLTRTVVVEAGSYLEAEDIVADAYYNGNLQLHADNSAVDLELENDTDNYIEIFGEEEFYSMEVSEELR